MNVKGTYTTIGNFLHTYKKCEVISNFSDEGGHDNRWSFEADRQIQIPDYQREYKWGQKQLEELYTDLQNQNGYLGQIAVSHKSGEKTYNIVDGQQRITSILILITVLVRQFYVYEDELNIQAYELHKPENNSDGGNTISKTTFEANCFSGFQDFISNIYLDKNPETTCFETSLFNTPTTDDYQQCDIIINACSILNDLLLKALGQFSDVPRRLDQVKNMLDKILNTRISVVVFEGNGLGESERIFLDINEKGLKLDNEDILKAYYFRSVRTENLAITTWKKIKTNYFKLKRSIGSGKNAIPLDCIMNFALQVALFSGNAQKLDFEKFDNDLHYDSSNKQHICQLFTSTKLQQSFQKIETMLDVFSSLVEFAHDSQYYCDYFNENDSTTRQVFSTLFTTIIKADMKIVFIVLSKLWWIRNNHGEKMNLDDIVQLFAFYIITNISGIKKEKSNISQSFISSQTIQTAYDELIAMEKNLLSVSSEKSLALKRDQEKAEYLSFNIQMFYNDFRFESAKKLWTIALSNQDFLKKYSSNRKLFIKDHFLIQNGTTIQLYGGNTFQINASMKTLRKRAYNFIYHKDTFGNGDFVTRLVVIQSMDQSDYGKYELAYFDFVKTQFLDFYKHDELTISWNDALDKYRSNAQHDYPQIISFILQERISSWNRRIGTYILSQFDV